MEHSSGFPVRTYTLYPQTHHDTFRKSVARERDAEEAVLYLLRCLLSIIVLDMKRILEEVTGGKFEEKLTLNQKLLPSLKKVKGGALEEFTRKYGGYTKGEKAACVWVDDATEWIEGPRKP